MKTLPCVRASFLEPFCLVAKEFGAPSESIMQSVGLPAQLPEEKEMLLLEVNCWKYVHSMAKREGCSTFGLMAGETKPWSEIITIQPLFKDCLNLYELLKRLVIIAPTQSLTSRFALIEEDDFIWLINLCPRLLSEKQSVQIELFDTLGLIQLVQACAGKNWRPEEIHLTIDYNKEVENASQLNPSRIVFSQAHAKIKIPRYLLSLPTLKSIADKCAGAKDMDSVETIPDKFLGQLSSVVTTYLDGAAVNKTMIATALDISPRTLQRRLEQCSSSFSTIIDGARFDKAQQLLQDSDMTIIEISLMLGYQNASSFTRSFRRLSGVSPKEFRLYGI